MERPADEVPKGSFDDVPDAALRTVLAIPLALPPLPEAVPVDPAGAPSVVEPRGARRRGHRRARAPRAPRSELAVTLQVGLSAALTVFLAVALLMLAVQAFVR